jgi:hypothetical protein
MFTPSGGKTSSGGKSSGFSFSNILSRRGSQEKKNGSKPIKAPVPVVGAPDPANKRSQGSFMRRGSTQKGSGSIRAPALVVDGPNPVNNLSQGSLNAGPAPSQSSSNTGRGPVPSQGFVNDGRGSGQSPGGSEPSRSPATIAQEQGPSSNVRAGAGRKTSLMMTQPKPGVPLIDFDSDDYSSDDEPQRGPPPPNGGFPGQTIPGVSPGSTTTGSAEARPMVGGFAAAAYEAAKAHHFATKGKQKQANPMPRRSTKRQIVY